MNQQPTRHLKKVKFGHVHADHVTFGEALEVIDERIRHGRGGYVVTPNVDHVCLAEESPDLRDAYRDASLSVVDGMPLLWLAKLMGHPLPEKISGSDLVRPLLGRAVKKKWRVYFLGGAAGVGEEAARRLQEEMPALEIVGIDSPPLGFEKNDMQNSIVLEKIRKAKPQLILVALGCPKQELWMQRSVSQYAPAMAVGIGATLDFIAGRVRRSPPWMSKVGLEWVYRLCQEPKRMASRYLVRDRAIVGIAWRMLMTPKAKRAYLA